MTKNIVINVPISVKYDASTHFCFKQILHSVIKSILKFHRRTIKENTFYKNILIKNVFYQIYSFLN